MVLLVTSMRAMNTDISNLLEPEEKVFWQGVISRKVVNTSTAVMLLITFVIAGYLLTQGSIQYTQGDQAKQVSGSVMASIVAILGIGFSLLRYFQQIVVEYVVTSKRAMVKSGLIGTDFQSIYFEQMKEVLVDVDLIGKIFSVGTVKIDTGKTETYSTSTGYGNNQQDRTQGMGIKTRTMYSNLSYIDTPYEVYKYINSAISGRKESLYSGRADQEHLQGAKS